MRTSTRRKLDGFLLAGTGIVAGVAGGAGAVQGDAESVTNLWAQAVVAQDGTAQVSEVVDYNFGAAAVFGDKHGIFRVVPDLAPDAPILVSSDSAPDGLEVTTEAAGTRLRIGDADQTVSGEKRYRIEYPLPGVAVDQTIDWDAVGTAWEVGIERAEIHLLTPYEVVDPRCFVGREGSNKSCDDLEQVDPGHLVATVEGLDAGEGVSLEATAGAPLGSPPVVAAPPRPLESEDEPFLPAAALPAGASVAAAAVTGRLIRRAGRERVGVGGAADAAWAGAGPEGGNPVAWRRVDHAELEQMATTEFAPPENLTAAQGGVVLTETVEPEHKVAWLIETAISGAVDLVEEGDKVVGLRRTGPGSPDAAPVLDLAFAGRPELDLGSYDSNFASAWSMVAGQLDQWRHSSGLWDARADVRRMVACGVGAVAAVAGVIAALAGGWQAVQQGPGWLVLSAVGGVLCGAGLAPWIRGWEMRVRTPAGSAAWLRTESFRRFLAESEAYHAEEAAKRGVLREYTAWAVAVGEIDRWGRAVKASTISPTDAGMAYVYAAPFLMSSTASTATAPSSSGGGGGGGSVGGGAGGGGGGSW